MTFVEWVVITNHKYLEISSDDRPRYGQHLFNTLILDRRDLASQIVGTDKDPFYVKDPVDLQPFFTWLLENW